MRLPEKFEDRMKKMLGDEYDDFIKSMDETPIFTGIRINTSKVGAKDAVIKEFGELQNVSWCSDGFYADKSKISGNHPYHLYFLILILTLPSNKKMYNILKH